MKCPDIGMIQAYIDGELEIEDRKQVENHVSGCEACTVTYNELKGNDDFVFEKLKNYKQFVNDNFNPASKTPAVKTKNDNAGWYGQSEIKKGAYYYMLKYKKIVAAACAVAVIAACISIQPVRAAISNALSIFRAERIEGITFTLNDMREIQQAIEAKEPEINMDKFGKIKTTGGENRNITKDEIKNISEFKVLLPSVLDSINPEINTMEPSKVEFTLNVEKFNGLLKSLGADKLLPASIDGKTFAVNLSRMVNINYTKGKLNYSVMQAKTPEIVVPEGVDADEIYASMVDLPIIPGDLKKQLKSIKDWRSTLYIPITEDMEEVSINGSKGYLHSTNDVKNNYEYVVLIWCDDGIIYSVQGNSGKEEIIKIAESMR